MARAAGRVSEARPDDRAYAQLLDKLDTVNAKLEKLEEKTPAEKATPWYTVLINFIALPAAILAIMIQWGQVRSSGEDRAKTVAETAKFRTEEVKARAELEKTLDDLSAKRATSVDAYRSELEAALPKIQKSLTELQVLTKTVKPEAEFNIVLKFIILWGCLIGMGLIFEIFTYIWQTLVSSLRTFARNSRSTSQTWRNVVSYADPFLLYAPMLLTWSIRWMFFFFLVVPFITELSGLLGFPNAISNAINSFGSLHFVDAFTILKSLFTSS
jgi:hypothetical protein